MANVSSDFLGRSRTAMLQPQERRLLLSPDVVADGCSNCCNGKSSTRTARIDSTRHIRQSASMGLCGSKESAARRDARAQFRRIPDEYETIEEVQGALRQAGLEACQLIVGVDFTKSNCWTGQHSFGGRCLHAVDGPVNPYLQALYLIARTLEAFDDDRLIPCYGFGDDTTAGSAVFSFYPDNKPAKGLQNLLIRYRQMVPHVNLSGPTSFAPLIRQAMRLVFDSGMNFHVLLILADGLVSQSCVRETMDAIVEAAHFPMPIVMVGVGDGPWNLMRHFDDSLPERGWDNFQFVELNRLINNSAFATQERRDSSFALHALMELPEQYRIAERFIGERAQQAVSGIVRRIPRSVLVNPPASTCQNQPEFVTYTQPY